MLNFAATLLRQGLQGQAPPKEPFVALVKQGLPFSLKIPYN